MVLFIVLYRVVLIFKSVDEILKCDPVQMKAPEQYFPVVWINILHTVVLRMILRMIEIKAIEQYNMLYLTELFLKRFSDT